MEAAASGVVAFPEDMEPEASLWRDCQVLGDVAVSQDSDGRTNGTHRWQERIGVAGFKCGH